MGSKVIGLPGVSQPTNEVVVLEPRSFDEMARLSNTCASAKR